MKPPTFFTLTPISMRTMSSRIQTWHSGISSFGYVQDMMPRYMSTLTLAINAWNLILDAVYTSYDERFTAVPLCILVYPLGYLLLLLLNHMNGSAQVQAPARQVSGGQKSIFWAAAQESRWRSPFGQFRDGLHLGRLCRGDTLLAIQVAEGPEHHDPPTHIPRASPPRLPPCEASGAVSLTKACTPCQQQS